MNEFTLKIKKRDEYVAKLIPDFLGKTKGWKLERISSHDEDYYDHVDVYYSTPNGRVKVQLKIRSKGYIGFRDIDVSIYKHLGSNEFELTDADYVFKVFLDSDDVVNSWDGGNIIKIYSLNVKKIKESKYKILVNENIRGIKAFRNQLWIGTTKYGNMSFPHSINNYIPGVFEIIGRSLS